VLIRQEQKYGIPDLENRTSLGYASGVVRPSEYAHPDGRVVALNVVWMFSEPSER